MCTLKSKRVVLVVMSALLAAACEQGIATEHDVARQALEDEGNQISANRDQDYARFVVSGVVHGGTADCELLSATVVSYSRTSNPIGSGGPVDSDFVTVSVTRTPCNDALTAVTLSGIVNLFPWQFSLSTSNGQRQVWTASLAKTVTAIRRGFPSVQVAVDAQWTCLDDFTLTDTTRRVDGQPVSSSSTDSCPASLAGTVTIDGHQFDLSNVTTGRIYEQNILNH